MSLLSIARFITFFSLFIQLFGLTCAVLIDNYSSKKTRKAMFAVTALLYCLIIQNIGEYYLSNHNADLLPALIKMRIFTSALGYSIRPIIIFLFCCIVSPERRHRVGRILIVTNIAVYSTSFFSRLCFTIDDNNHFQGGPLSRSCYYISLFLLLYLFYLMVVEYSAKHISDIWIPIISEIFIVISIYLDSVWDSSTSIFTFLTVAMTGSCVLYYIWLHLQFVREHENDLKAQQRIQIMMTQIQPHFMYNTLGTIQALCLTDPQKAFDITAEFSAYLRDNIESLGKPDLIPVYKEIEHTKIYTDIEMTRFPDLNVEYNIEDSGFFLPALTIQPLVENAIRHGVLQRDNPIVKVTVSNVNGSHRIEINDNGVGFDIEKTDFTQSDHIGIRNVRERIEKMCGGSLEIGSVMGEGTAVVLKIPCAEESDRMEKTKKRNILPYIRKCR